MGTLASQTLFNIQNFLVHYRLFAVQLLLYFGSCLRYFLSLFLLKCIYLPQFQLIYSLSHLVSNFSNSSSITYNTILSQLDLQIFQRLPLLMLSQHNLRKHFVFLISDLSVLSPKTTLRLINSFF